MSTEILLPNHDIITPTQMSENRIILPPGTRVGEHGERLAQIDLTAGGALGTSTLNLLESPTDEVMAEAEFANPRQLNELKYIFKDILSGDPTAARDERFTYLNFKQIQTALEWIMTNNFDESLQQLLLEKPYLLTFKNKPPTPEEFLTHKYIGSMADSVWLPVRKNFVNYFDPLKPCRNGILNPAIGSGKSTFTMLALLFVAASFALMRDPWKFFNKSKTTVFAICLCAVTLTKAKEIYEEPIRQLIESADFWHFCRSHQEMLNEENHLLESDEVEYIPWATGGPQPLDSKVYLPDGSYKLMGDIKVGDTIASPTTKECTVIDIPYESNNDICYEIELDDGRTCKCAANHKWRVAWEKDKNGDWTWKVVPIEFIINHPEIEFEIFEGEYTKHIMDAASSLKIVQGTIGKKEDLLMAKIKSVKKIESQPVKCITVSNEDGMYITDNFINTHNSVGVFRTGNNMTWKVISQANSLLGVNILMGCMTEITFFKEAGKGWTDEKIFNFFSKLKERISNRFQSNYYARMILDSSPSTLEDPIQNWMSYDAPKLEENYIWKGSRWDLYPGEFPDYCEVDKPGTLEEKLINPKNNYDVAFQLYKGGNGKPPAVCENEGEASQYNAVDLIWCPRKQVTKNGTANFLNKAKENPIEFMKDWAGLPAGTPDRLFYKNEWIEDCFDNGLKNNYGAIVALADDEPEHLIWNQIWSKFFYKVMGKYYFYYEPNVPRVVSVDMSKARDCTGISMSHVELDPERIDPHTGRPLEVYITDFTIILIPKGGHINLDAIKFFIHDLKYLGGINLRHVAFDGWQSDAARQFLKRDGITVDYVSVDSNNEPYYMFYDVVTHGRWHCGKNIFIKNNMKSLHEVRRKTTGSVKIDHFEGELNYEWENGTWESCTAGVNAKDGTDSIASNLYLFSLYPGEFIATKKFYKEDKLDRDYDTIKEKNAGFLMSGKIDGIAYKI